MSTPSTPAAGWYPDPDPAQQGGQRWWTGLSWSESTRPGSTVAPPPGYSTRGTAPQGVPPAAYPPAYPAAPPGVYPAQHAGQYPGQGAGYPAQTGYPGYPSHPGQAAYPAQPGYAVAQVPLAPPGRPMGFGEAISAVLRNYAGFGGRASRSEFWYWYLLCTLVLMGGYALMVPLIVIDNRGLSVIGGLLALLLLGLALAIIVPTLAVTVRRLRDAGLPWALIFLELVPYVGGIIVLVLCAQRAKPWALPRV